MGSAAAAGRGERVPRRLAGRARSYGRGVLCFLLGLLALAVYGAPREAERGAEELKSQRAALDRLLATPAAPRVAPPSLQRAVDDETLDEATRRALVDLGRDLFFEPRLSADGSLACASCHDARLAFTDGRALASGMHGRSGRRNTPSVLYTGYLEELFWDGRVRSLEQQAAMPILAPSEMALPDLDTAIERLAADYDGRFRKLFGRAPTPYHLRRALAEFQRSLAFFEAPIDDFLAGDEDALTAEQRAGWELFRGRALCGACHVLGEGYPLATDQQFHNLGVAAREDGFPSLVQRAPRSLNRIVSLTGLDGRALGTALSGLGRFVVTRRSEDLGAFRTPSLRNVALTAPYMHDGSMATLREVVEFYVEGGNPNPHLSEILTPLELDAQEVDQLVAFLSALTDARYEAAAARALAEQEERHRRGAREGVRAEPGKAPGAAAGR
ncbi:MAG: cytochrome c peroxidase [Acidobacteriota bacterium]